MPGFVGSFRAQPAFLPGWGEARSDLPKGVNDKNSLKKFRYTFESDPAILYWVILLWGGKWLSRRKRQRTVEGRLLN